jgi:polygalacturonase
VGDGVTVNTKACPTATSPLSSHQPLQAIQACIDYASEQGGGNVVVPEGNFLTGSIMLKNGTYLYVDAGAQLLASTNVTDYPADPTLWVVVLSMVWSSLSPHACDDRC